MNNFENKTRDELIAQIKQLQSQRRFGLVWEDKSEQVVKDIETKLPVLTEVEERQIQRGGATQMNLPISLSRAIITTL